MIADGERLLAVFRNSPAKLVAVAGAVDSAAIRFVVETGVHVPVVERFEFDLFISAHRHGKILDGEVA